ncbi:MAG: acyltransferase family protein, partial [Prevotella sp.]|nr:acyltransferase family protein [Prevotella sp.]
MYFCKIIACEYMEQIKKSSRMEWLDALRGFTMIMVVANHVSLLGFEQEWKHSSALSFLILFRMPLFFFVSGFLAYKASQVWNLRELGYLLLKKMRVQIIPTVVFFLLFSLLICPKFFDGVVHNFHSPMKGGYWFTIALLWMFIIYYIFSYLESKLRVRSWIPIAILFVVSLGIYETCYLPKYFPWAMGYRGQQIQWLNDTSLCEVMKYLPFFLMGVIVRRYWEQA